MDRIQVRTTAGCEMDGDLREDLQRLSIVSALATPSDSPTLIAGDMGRIDARGSSAIGCHGLAGGTDRCCPFPRTGSHPTSGLGDSDLVANGARILLVQSSGLDRMQSAESGKRAGIG